MFLSNISIKRPIMVSMGLSVFLLFGVLSFLKLPLNLLPKVEFPYVTIQTAYPGAGPKELETLVTNKIEDAVSTIGKIEMIRSFSMENVSYIIMKFDLDKDANVAAQEVRDKVSAMVGSLPGDVETPIIEKFDIGAMPVMELALTGSMPRHQLFQLADAHLKDQLSQIQGVGKVNIVGKQEREIRIEFENRTVFQNKISLPQLTQILAAHNLDLPSGHFEEQSQELSVRMKGAFSDVASIRNLEVPTVSGMKKIGELADVQDTATEIRQKSTYFSVLNQEQHDNVVLLSIIKSVDGNAVEMAKTIKKRLPELEKNLPEGSKLFLTRDESLFIESSVSDTLGNILLGVAFTGLVLLFFLHDLRSTIIVAVAMPFSIISTFLFLNVFGFSLNIMSLMGLSTAVGVLVTNSVVVLENIFRHKGLGLNRKEAANVGTTETAVAVIASTMTNIVVFLPIANMSGLVGQFFKEFALTVTFATVFSIIASFTITPMLAALILPKTQTKPGIIGSALENIFSATERFYKNTLAIVLKNKFRSFGVIIAAIALFMGVMWKIAPKVGFEFMPMMDQGDINIEVELPEGYNLNQLSALLETIENRISRHKEVKHIVTTLGSISEMNTGTNLAVAKVKLVDKKQRNRSSSQMASIFTRELSEIPNAVIRIAMISSGGEGGEAPVLFYLKGQDIKKLEQYKKEILERIKSTPGLINLNTSSKSGKPEITLIPDRRKVSEAGLSVVDLAMTLRASLEGLVATQYREAGEEYDIRLKLNRESVNTPEKVGNIVVVSEQGVFKLSQLADIHYTEGTSKILHMDKSKSIEFSGYTADGFPLGNIVAEIEKRTAEIPFENDYIIDWGGNTEMMQEAVSDMFQTFLIALILTYMLLAAILESFTQPIMILATVPLSFIGVFSALFISGSTMNIISMMAIIMLLGIVVNNAILMLDYANNLRRNGSSIAEALLEACPTKLKPIIMSTVAIALGMLPMALGIGDAGVEMRQPMGIVSIGGLIISALMTLLVIPAIYNIFSREKKAERDEQLTETLTTQNQLSF